MASAETSAQVGEESRINGSFINSLESILSQTQMFPAFFHLIITTTGGDYVQMRVILTVASVRVDYRDIATLEPSPFNMCPYPAKLLPHLKASPYLAWR
jgi:hypothetical protein